MAAGVFTPYSETDLMVASFPAWVPPDQQSRVASYSVYEQVYWNHAETFKVILRGDEPNPIYIPSGRIMVETANRYVGKGMQIIPDAATGQPAQQEAMSLAFKGLFDREKFYAKYNTAKRFGLIHGDWMLHIRADELKEDGKRISLTFVDPGSYFTTPDPENEERILQVHLVDTIVDEAGNQRVRKQTYTKLDDGKIQSELADFEQDKWFGEDLVMTQQIIAPFVLPDIITAFPVYHIQNGEQPGSPYGNSEMRGLVSLMKAVNQGATDEDIALAMDALGLYVTSAGSPVDENEDETDWIIGPGRVLEGIDPENFKRVNGVTTVQPYQDHLNYLGNSMYEATGANDAARGQVDVSVAESGVALALRLAPMIAIALEKDELIKGTLTQFAYDLAVMWFPAYESSSFGDCLPVVTFGEKLPQNRESEIKLLGDMMSTPTPIISAATARKHLSKFGWEFEANEAELIAAEQAAILGVAASGGSADPVGERAAGELEA